jgi:TonB-dependent starch-binding outer membrane protein SusC
MKKCFTPKAQIWKVMRSCTLHSMFAITLCATTWAHSNFAQLLDKPLSLELHDVTLSETLHEIENVTNVKFVYSPNQLHADERISLKVTHQTLRKVLEELLIPREINYKVHEAQSIITLKRKTRLSMGVVTQSNAAESMAESRTPQIISGTITESVSSQPLAGVNVFVKGTSRGTTSDARGHFSIEVDADEILVFSFIGYQAQEIRITGQSTLNIALQEETKNLNEVVINAGYYSTTKATQTGNIIKVTANDIEKQPVSNPIATLMGRVPGLEVTQQTGVPGGNFKVRIRGTNSIANGNDPLYIIDGVPFMSTSMSLSETSGNILGNPNAVGGGSGPLNSINPADIESIEVLKDADATAIYGSRGANGVILITTKQGHQGDTKVEVIAYTGAGRITNTVKLLDRSQYLQMRKEAFANSNSTPTLANARDLVVWDTTRYTDWQKELLGGNAITNDVQLRISGGNLNTSFSVGGGYHRETTVFPGNNADQRVSTNITISNTSTNQKLKSSFTFNYAENNTNLIKEDLTRRALILPPVAPATKDENGNISWTNWNFTYENPIAFLNRKYEATTTNLIANSVISYAITPALEIKTSMGITRTAMTATTLTPISSLDPVSAMTAQNQTYFGNSAFNNWIIEPQAIFKQQVGPGTLSALVGATFLDQTSEGFAESAFGFTSEALMKNRAAAPGRFQGTNYYSQYRYHAVFSRINYALHDKYLVNLTARRDGSSRFGPGNQFATFAAIGTAWIFSQEKFFKEKLSVLSFGKIRASYGTTGNDQLGDYQYLDTYRFSNGLYQGQIGLTPARLNNPDFAWETNTKLEGALELGFLDDKIWTAISVYQNRSSNQLVGYPLPPTTGFTSIQGNFPATVQNTGIELEINFHILQKTNFTWKTMANLTVPKNKLLEFPNIEASPTYANAYEVGEPLSIRKQYKLIGVDPVTGIYRVEDVNQDGAFNTEDRKTIIFVGQRYFGGLLNTLQWKNIQLDFLFQFVKQTGVNFQTFFDVPGLLTNQPAHVMQRWQQEGDVATIQRFATTGAPISTYTRYRASNQIITDASFIRLKNLSLAYTLPKEWLQKLNINNARIFIQGQNLLTITDYEGFDPEYQNLSLPPLRVLTGGISINL